MFVLQTLAPKTDMPLKMLQVAIPRAISKPCYQNRFATPENSISAEMFVLPTLGAGILSNGEKLAYLPEHCVQQLSVCLPLLIQPLVRKIAVLDCDWQQREYLNDVH
jgi:hypothetical protein